MCFSSNMVTALFQHERIITTHPKAKATQRIAERLLTLTKRPSTRHYQEAAAFIRSPATTVRMFDVFGPRYANRPGGYTRVVRLKERRGDNADMSVLELVDREGEVRLSKECDEQYARDRDEVVKEYQVWQQQQNKLPGLEK